MPSSVECALDALTNADGIGSLFGGTYSICFQADREAAHVHSSGFVGTPPIARNDGMQFGACFAIAYDFAAQGRHEACVHPADRLFAMSEPVARHEFQHALRDRFCGRSKTLQALLIRRSRG